MIVATLQNLGITAPLDTSVLLLVIQELGGEVATGAVPKGVVTKINNQRFRLTVPLEPEGFPGSRAWRNRHLLMGLLEAIVRHGFRLDPQRWEKGIPIIGILDTWSLYADLAMPKDLFRDQAEILTLESMSDYFGVPVMDIEARAVELGLRPSRYIRIRDYRRV